MDSTALKAHGISTWAAFVHLTERELLATLPTSAGVYVILLAQSEQRRRGASDIAYIGRAGNQNGLRGRVRQYFHPGPTQSTNIAMRQRICAPDCALRLGRLPRARPICSCSGRCGGRATAGSTGRCVSRPSTTSSRGWRRESSRTATTYSRLTCRPSACDGPPSVIPKIPRSGARGGSGLAIEHAWRRRYVALMDCKT